jgi:hypothetical protein
MKAKIIVFFIIVVATLGLTGCKPKPVALSGQIFIVTQGGENIKLGDVEILLIEKSQVVNFLVNKLPIVEYQITSNRFAFEMAETNYLIAQTNYDSFETTKPDKDKEDYMAFLSDSHFNSYPNFDRIKQNIIKLKQDSDRLYKYSGNLNVAASSELQAGNYTESSSDSTLSGEDSSQAFDFSQQADQQLGQLQEFIDNEENSLLTVFDAAQNAETATLNNLNNFPGANDYFVDFFPTAFQAARSDADGRFSFIYPKNKSFTIYASATRAIVSGEETYYWLVDVPTNSGPAQIFLSNDNLVYNDPDGYFKIRPKQQTQTSSSNQ